jgi:hypothetical protein
VVRFLRALQHKCSTHFSYPMRVASPAHLILLHLIDPFHMWWSSSCGLLKPPATSSVLRTILSSAYKRQCMFLPYCERPGFTPEQNKSNYSLWYFILWPTVRMSLSGNSSPCAEREHNSNICRMSLYPVCVVTPSDPQGEEDAMNLRDVAVGQPVYLPCY